MPVEQKPRAGREKYSHLEAFGRLMCGIAPWLALTGLSGPELKLQQQYIAWSHTALDNATRPGSPDFLNFNDGGQALVDAAFLAQGLLRAPDVLWTPLPDRVKTQLIDAFVASRKASDPKTSNWVMFAAMVEAFLLHAGQATVPSRLEANLRLMLGWYLGDGAYGDGEFYHHDYYNALVIQPMLVDVLGVLKAHDPRFTPAYDQVLTRSTRYAAVQERTIAPDGSFPPLGRSLTYRFGALQTLAQMAWMDKLPAEITPAQVRCALTATIRRLIEAKGTFDAKGWLTIGFAGHQPGLGEPYISTGSLYLCAAGMLPLGLPPAHAFWSAAAAPWSSQTVWGGVDQPADHALKDVRQVEVPDLKP
ncbi:DUF2264 domain-containing protein [Asticcacaulis sp. YBE204]|uniref:DUF2264 domain-containing protein n=1 Tax=Asticcacaulis sp. YBE204 TaxID=1282363 RepID=UPI00190F3E25|nr:DUF2264 domain-containing protein [Asticcacaulis sp. YBE204]